MIEPFAAPLAVVAPAEVPAPRWCGDRAGPPVGYVGAGSRPPLAGVTFLEATPSRVGDGPGRRHG